MKKHLLTPAVFITLACLFLLAANDWDLPWAGPKRAAGVEWCEPHDMELAKCEVCNPALARGGTQVIQGADPLPGQCPNTTLRIMLGEGVADRIGLELATVEMSTIEERLEANAETEFEPGRYSRVAPRVSGTIAEVLVGIGQQVSEGDVLAVVEAPELGRTKSEYLQALSTEKLRQALHDSKKSVFPKITTRQQMAEAEATLEAARVSVRLHEQHLEMLGLSKDGIASVKETGSASPRLEVKSPFDGTVVSLTAVQGELGSPDRPIVGVADMSRMWLVIDVYEHDLPKIESDQKVRFVVDGLPGTRFPGRVVAVGGEVDDHSRTVRVFASIKNRDGLLKANMFGRAEVRIRPEEPKLLAPRNAVQNDGDCHLAFVSPSKGTFLPKTLEIGAVYAGGYEIVGGLAPGDRVVTTGSFLLKTEILRGQIGAG